MGPGLGRGGRHSCNVNSMVHSTPHYLWCQGKVTVHQGKALPHSCNANSRVQSSPGKTIVHNGEVWGHITAMLIPWYTEFISLFMEPGQN